MKKRRILSTVLLLICLACWQRQKHDILRPEIPHYTLSGYTVDIDDTTRVLPDIPVSLTAVTLLYDATFDPVSIRSESNGYFQIDSVIPGDYILAAWREGYTVISEPISMEHAARIRNINLPRPFVNTTSYHWLGGYAPRFTFATEGLWIMTTTVDFNPPQVLIPVLYEYSLSINRISAIGWIRVPYLITEAIAYRNGLLYFYNDNHVSNLNPQDQNIHEPKPTLIDSFRIESPLEAMTWDGTGFWTTFGSSLQYRGTDLRTVTGSWAVDSGRLSALAVEGNHIWAYDKDRDLLLKLDPTGNVLWTRRLINVDTRSWVIAHDLAFSPFGTLWVSQQYSKFLFEFDTGLLASPPHQ